MSYNTHTMNIGRPPTHSTPPFTRIPRRLTLSLLGFSLIASTGLLAQETTDKFDAQFEEFSETPPAPARADGAVNLENITPPRERPAQSPKNANQNGQSENGVKTIRSLGRGVASYYGRRFHGRRTANGERFNMNALTAAHKSLPFGTRVRVTNRRNGKSVVVRINDRGPFVRGRTIDLSRKAGAQIGLVQTGHANVTIDIVG